MDALLIRYQALMNSKHVAIVFVSIVCLFDI